MAKKRLSDIDRFWQSVEVTTGSCWIWTKPLDRDGYARQWRIGSRTDGSRTRVRPHRFIYESVNGPIPEGEQIDHLCRCRSCVNPSHLDVVTPLENTQRGWRASKLVCKHGHPLYGPNLYISPIGMRVCRTCARRATSEHGKKTGWAAQARFKAGRRKSA